MYPVFNVMVKHVTKGMDRRKSARSGLPDIDSHLERPAATNNANALVAHVVIRVTRQSTDDLCGTHCSQDRNSSLKKLSYLRFVFSFKRLYVSFCNRRSVSCCFKFFVGISIRNYIIVLLSFIILGACWLRSRSFFNHHVCEAPPSFCAVLERNIYGVRPVERRQ